MTPGTIVQGQVQNPGTLGTVNPLQKANYLNVTSYQVPFSTSAYSTFNNLMNYLESHPLVMLVTIFFVLIIIVVIIRAIV